MSRKLYMILCIEIKKKERNKDKIFKFEKRVSDAVATEIKTSNYKESKCHANFLNYLM